MPKPRPEAGLDPGSCGTAPCGAAEGGARPDPERSSSRRPSGPGATLDELRERLEQLRYRNVAQRAAATCGVERVGEPREARSPDVEARAVVPPGDEPKRAIDDSEERSGSREGQAASRVDPSRAVSGTTAARGPRRGDGIAAKDGPPDPYRKALGLLVRREHSRRELKRKLGSRGIEAPAIEAALDTLEGQGYQDDARFAEMLVRSRIGGGYGPLHIRAELGTHGVGVEVIASAFAEAAPDWPALARDALRRRYGARPPADRAETIKRAHFLQRRGFDLDSIRAATSASLDE